MVDNRLAQPFRFALHEERADVIRMEIVRRPQSIVAKLMSIHASFRGKDIAWLCATQILGIVG